MSQPVPSAVIVVLSVKGNTVLGQLGKKFGVKCDLRLSSNIRVAGESLDLGISERFFLIVELSSAW